MKVSVTSNGSGWTGSKTVLGPSIGAFAKVFTAFYQCTLRATASASLTLGTVTVLKFI